MTMKLEKFEDKSMSKRKVLLISLGVIMLISVSLLLYKNKNLKENDDVYFAFYNGNEKLESMPLKDNDEDLVFAHGECDNGASIEWNNNEWAPLVKNLSKSKTKCSLYFKKSFAKTVVKCGQEGKSATECITDNMNLDETLIYDDYNNLRYTGANPNNYVSFNDGELWRIIGIIDGKLKIISTSCTEAMQWNSINENTWENSALASYLNNSYSIDSNLIVDGNWNVGESDYNNPKIMYDYEQQKKWTGKVGLITASDYGYAVGGIVRSICLEKGVASYGKNDCYLNNWFYLMDSKNHEWTMTTFSESSGNKGAYVYHSLGHLDRDVVTSYARAFPTVYLKETTRITGGTGEEGSPFILE